MNDNISVIMTSYNSNEKFLNEAIMSVLNQTYKHFEFIIIDDGSTNKVLDKVVNEIKSDKIKVVKQENKGLCNARNTGISLSSGQYIAFLDDDDVWYNTKLQESIDFFEEIKRNDENIGVVFTQSTIIDELGKEYGVFGYKVKGNIFEKILGKNIIGPPSSVLIDRKVLEDVGGFNSKYIYAEDLELWYRVTKKYNVYSINKPLIKYRYRTNSLSKNYRKMALYTEEALLTTINREDIRENKSEILSKYYIDYAYLFFSNSDSKMYKEYYKKSIKSNFKNIMNSKLLFGYIFSLFGDNIMKLFNNRRRKNNIVPPSYLKVYDYS